MATIAQQIERIAKATADLRTKGIELDLSVRESEPLNLNHKIDDVAKAFSNMPCYEEKVISPELPVRSDGSNTIVEETHLPAGFYKDVIIRPYFEYETNDDTVLNIQTLTNYKIQQSSGIIQPDTDAGYNYLKEIIYTVTPGKLNTSSVEYGSNYVKATVDVAGWLEDTYEALITVPTSIIKSKVYGESEVQYTTKEFSISPDYMYDTVVTISKGIYDNTRTITIPSVKNITTGTATHGDILETKTAWVNGVLITGTMPNYGGTSESTASTTSDNTSILNRRLVVTPKPGYYNSYSSINTDILVGEGSHSQTYSDLQQSNHQFTVKSSSDKEFFTEITIDNSLIYQELVKI